MSKTYLPTSEQFDVTLSSIAKIAGVLGAKVDTSTWRGIQNAVKAGLAPQLFPIGTQLVVSHSVYGDMLYDVVAHDHYKSVKDENAHTMTLMCHDLLANMMYDMREAFYYAESELPAGTYSFTIPESYLSWEEGTYHFTLTQALPKGGQLTIDGSSSASITTYNVKSYADPITSTSLETVTISSGNSGTSLGTFGRELNHVHRITYGSNNYKESAIRQFLNSAGDVGGVWSPQTKYDRPPAWVSSTAGFMKGLSRDFLNVVGKVILPCAANNIYESPDSTITAGNKYTLNDKFYLPSMMEVFGEYSNGTVADDSVLFPYYNGATNADLLKYRNGVADYWWTRSPVNWAGNVNRRVGNDGSATDSYVLNTAGISPVCTIV